MPGTGMGQSQTCARPSPQAILPLMKFLEVELCYMNTNLVQENFSRSARLPAPWRPPPPSLLPGLGIHSQGRMAPASAHSQGHEAPRSP